MNVIVLSNIDWRFLRQRHHYVTEAFLDCGDEVVFVESTGKRLPGWRDIGRILRRLAGRRRGETTTGQAPADRLRVISPIALPSTNRFFNAINRRFFLRRLSTRISGPLDKTSRTLVYTFLPTASSNTLIDLLDPDRVVYDCVSNYAALEPESPGITRSEQDLIGRADQVITDCDFLRAKHLDAAGTIDIFQPMVEYGLFSPLQDRIPERVERVCYFGLFDSHKIDVDVVADLAPHTDVTIIGPVGSNLERRTDVTYMNEVPHQHLPRLLADFDGLLLPYNAEEFTKGIIPAKMFECLATGLPVFALHTPNLATFEDSVYLASDADQMLKHIQSYAPATDAPRRRRRIELARTRDVEPGKRELVELVSR